MAKPALLTLDDDPDVLRADERDLRRRYGDRFRVLRADAGDKALDILRQLKERGDPAALFLVDQRMPGMTGVEFLQQAMQFYPEAKRVLLTAYADTEAAIRAINGAKIDYYLMKPWDPPEELLYPILDDLIENWGASYRPPFEGIRVLGHRWSPRSHEIREFLARHLVPYRWLDVETSGQDPEVRRILGLPEDANEDPEVRVPGTEAVPLVLFPDGTRLQAPAVGEVAAKLGLQTRADKPFYDLVVVGGGPAGLAAAVYGASEGLSTLMVEREAPGGQAGTSSRIENYLGFPVGLSGADLTRRAVWQAGRFGVEILSPQTAEAVRVQDQYRIVQLADGSEVSCHALLIATGVQWHKLGVPSIDRLTGAGVYYGAASVEAISCQDEDVYIVGGANSAGQAAMHFSRYARRVIMLVRGDGLARSMSQYLIDQISRTPNIEVRTHTSVIAGCGDQNLEAILVKDAETGRIEQLAATSLFLFIGAFPHTDWLDGVVVRDDKGFLLTGTDLVQQWGGKRRGDWEALGRDPSLLESSLPGIFVAGDVRHGSIKRVASGVGEGAIAISFVHQYLSKV